MISIKVYVEGGCCIGVEVDGIDGNSWGYEIIDYDTGEEIRE